MISTRKRPLLLAAPFLPVISHASDRSPVGPTSQEMSLRAQDADVEELVAGNTDFAFDVLYAIEAASNGNLLFSPYSISLALAMTYAGARGDTATEMAEVLSFTLQQPDLHEAFRALSTDLVERGYRGGPPGSGTPHLANALWVEQSFPLDRSFNSEVESFYGSALHPVDFANEPEESRLEINDWVADQTEDRIRDMVPPNMIDERNDRWC